jgi:hypothetical protein
MLRRIVNESETQDLFRDFSEIADGAESIRFNKLTLVRITPA